MSRVLFLLAVFALSLAPARTRALSLDFDDLASGTQGFPMPAGYAGFVWTNFWYQSGLANCCGYSTGMVSAPTVLYNGNGDDASFSSPTPFDLDSLHLTAAFREGLQIDVTGYNGASAVSQTLTVDAAGPTLFTLGFQNILSVTFHAYGGTEGGFISDGVNFVLDDLTVSAVPEAGGIGLLLPMLVAAGLRRPRRRGRRFASS